MSSWPLPISINTTIPQPGTRGGFWEFRGDRHHAGIDLYAAPDCDVFAIENGVVVEVTQFTSPDILHYWNVTYSILLRSESGLLFRYAELGEALVTPGENVKSGQLIGHVGLVLNPDEIGPQDPGYIQELKSAGLPSMLHFEMHQSQPDLTEYLGGNYFSQLPPAQLMDPTPFLQSIRRDINSK